MTSSTTTVNYFEEMMANWATVQKSMFEDADAIAFDGFKPKVIRDAFMNTSGADKSDLVFLLTTVMTRGTKITKIQGKTKKEGVEKFNRLVKKYNISGAKPDKGDTMTLGRLSAAFPEISALVAGSVGRDVVMKDTGCPDYLKFPSALSLVPRTDKYKETATKWGAWAVEFDKVINKSPNADRVNQFGNSAFASDLFNDTQREQILNSLETAAWK